MNSATLFTHSIGQLFSASIIIVILLLMSFMSVSLFVNRRKKTYLYFTISLFFVIVQYVIMILVYGLNGSHNEFTANILQFLKTLSFILINIGIFQLYNPSRTKYNLLFYCCIIAAVLIATLHFTISKWFNGSSWQIQQLPILGLDLYLFLLLFICYFSVAPRIGQSRKYKLSLAIYFFMQITHLLNTSTLHFQHPVFLAIMFMLPVLYYAILFVILFECVVELLQASYTNSITDGLTGLYNRRYFISRVKQYTSNNIPVAILFADIDNFKKLNDTQGHQRGDEALCKVANVFKQLAEDVGLSGRYGGEEIVMLVAELNTPLVEFAESVRQRVESDTKVTVSIGCSTYRPGITAEALIKQADQAMYKAKTTGKNKVIKYVHVPVIDLP